MTNPKKILYVVTQSEIGGAQRYIFDLAENLKKQGYDIAVAAGGNDILFKKLASIGIRSYQLKHLIRKINPLKDFIATMELIRLLKKERPDVLHLNSSKAGVLGAIAGKLAGIKKIVYTVHGFVFLEPMPKWKKTFYILAEKFTAKFKDKLICVSNFDRQEGLKYKIAPTSKLITIHNGLDYAALQFQSNEEARNILHKTYNLKLIAYSCIIGTIANFYQTKGLIYLIQAAKLVTSEIKNVQFLVIGDGDGRNELEREIEANQLQNNFILSGQIENAYQLLNTFDIYVCSSVKEGFPYSILEAMATRRPIIATKVGGIPEMIINNTNGLLVEPKNPVALANGIIDLIKNQARREYLAAEAQKTIYENFTLQKMIKETLTAYNGN